MKYTIPGPGGTNPASVSAEITHDFGLGILRSCEGFRRPVADDEKIHQCISQRCGYNSHGYETRYNTSCNVLNGGTILGNKEREARSRRGHEGRDRLHTLYP